jgi:hypothetical protein
MTALVRYSGDGRRIYEPGGPALAAFLLDRSEIAVIRGPWGSGKSLACCQRIWQHAVEQHADSRGKRRSRWFVMRESYPKIETTAMATWLEWFPERPYGKLYTGSKPYVHEVRVGDIELDVFFGAVDDLAGDSPFKSLEPTGWWWNELEYASMRQFFAAHARVGRYPPVIEGGARWSGTIADMNAPPENHWLPMLTGEVDLPDDMPADERAAYQRPPQMAYFVQPPAVLEEKDAAGRVKGFRINPAAENLRFLTQPGDDMPPGERYYKRAMIGKPNRWVQSQLGNKIIPMVDGDAVWPNYDETVHVAAEPIAPVPEADVVIALDFGRRPAALFLQRVGGQLQVQFEAAMDNAGASKFAPEVRSVLARFYPWVLSGRTTVEVRAWGDPKGDDGTQTDERTAYDVFRAHGIIVRPAPVKQNNIRTRIEAVEFLLDRMINGRPALLISPRCRRLKMALAGGYRYPRERPSPVEERKPVKDRYSDIADCLQYGALGEGAGREMVGISGGRRSAPVSTRPDHQSRRRIGRAR